MYDSKSKFKWNDPKGLNSTPQTNFILKCVGIEAIYEAKALNPYSAKF